MSDWLGRAIVAISVAFFAIAPREAASWPADQARVGAENHPKVLKQFGGEISNVLLSDYVNAIGRRLVETTDYAHEEWTFTVMDSPVVNAFAVPGGYVYVTRGLLSLANSEAEIAGVIGHEIAHITDCLLYTSPSPRDRTRSRMPSSA